MEELEVKLIKLNVLRAQADEAYKLLVQVYGKSVEYEQLNTQWFMDWTDRINKLSTSW